MIDLHSHSSASDGTLSPDALLALAFERGITTFAITDHDTLAGYFAVKQQVPVGMQLVCGVEISCNHALVGGYGKHGCITKTIHVVALSVKDEERLERALQGVQESRASRARAIVQRLAQLSLVQEDVLWQQLLKLVDKPTALGRAHIAQALLALGVVKDAQEAFDKYLADGKSAYVPIETLSMAQTVALIADCGGLSVLAHPTRYGLSATRVRRLIADFAQMGGDGCELPSLSEPVSTRHMIDRQIALHGLLVSVGSDFHGSTMPWRRLGAVPTLTKGQVGVWERF